MCMGAKSPAEEQAEQARKEEQARQDRISQGRANIDDVFARFDDGYYRGIRDDYTAAGVKDLDQQHSDARRSLILNLTRSGNLASSSGASQLGRLQQTYNDRKVAIGNEAMDAANRQRGTIEDTRSNLYSQNVSSADPSSSLVAATQQVGALTPTQSYSPVANVFSGLIGTSAQGLAAEKAGNRGFGTGLFAGKATPSVRNVGG